jgi:hypothetical protein
LEQRKVYRAGGLTVIGMGLHPAGTLREARRHKRKGIVRPNKRSEVEILTPVTDAVSLANYVKDIGGIFGRATLRGLNGRPVATLMVTDIDVTGPEDSPDKLHGGGSAWLAYFPTV